LVTLVSPVPSRFMVDARRGGIEQQRRRPVCSRCEESLSSALGVPSEDLHAPLWPHALNFAHLASFRKGSGRTALR